MPTSRPVESTTGIPLIFLDRRTRTASLKLVSGFVVMTSRVITELTVDMRESLSGMGRVRPGLSTRQLEVQGLRVHLGEQSIHLRPPALDDPQLLGSLSRVLHITARHLAEVKVEGAE